MINRKKIIASGVSLLAAILIFTGCSDQFLEDKKDYSKVNDVYDNYATAKATINGIYALALSSSHGEFSWQYSSAGSNDVHSISTEEYSGMPAANNKSVFVDGTLITTSNSNSYLPNILYNERKTANNLYGWILSCNDAIEGIEASSGLTESEKRELSGQAYFFRAWVYYRLVKELGGVPIITKVQNPISGEVEALSIPRSTTKECIDFICDDLKIASEMLPASWSSTDYGRVTAGAALALQGRARLLYASPVFNRADNTDRWQLAYDSNKAAINKLQEGGFGLASLENPGINAAGWGKMFSEFQSKEAVFATLYNNVASVTSAQPNKWNNWENDIRPKNANGGGGKNATANMIDLFPMADGKKPGKSTFTYNKDLFMLNRDPRFYRTFAFPGVRWSYTENKDFELWNYVWYDAKDKLENMDLGGFSGDGLASEYKGIYIRKRTDDLDINSTTLYVYEDNSGKGFSRSASPYMEIRYAEVLLNLAESACGAGHLGEAVEILKQIRGRVGYTADNNYGLDAGISGDRAKLFEAILYERQIELAYEGKRFDDMRRWMLWDGGEGQGAIKASWALTGFGGNTCTYLGVQPFNGTNRRTIELRVTAKDGVVGDASATDPYLDTRPAAWNLAKETLADREDLVEFYTKNLVRKERTGDAKDKLVSFLPQYYIVGLKSNAQTNNPTLEQTIGWEDVVHGGAGTFDPLAE